MGYRVVNTLGLCALVLGGYLAKHSIEKKMRTQLGARNPALGMLEASYQGRSIQKYSLGFQSAIADLLWIETLQKSSIEPLVDGQVSWEFAHLDAMTTLDPLFERAYSFGSVYLSILRRDKIGAKILLEKWVHRRPRYWRSHYLLGFHYYSEMGDYERGASSMLKAASLPHAPPWLTALGVRLLSETGAHLHALQQCLSLYPEVRDIEGQYRLRLQIRALNFTLQKNGWEQALEQYRRKFHAEPSSLDAIRPYFTPQFREIASMVGTENASAELGPMMAEVFSFVYDAGKKAVLSKETPTELGLTQLGIYKREMKP
ncbi:MAG: hypothetical protein HY537_13840 [Deltaproteobacteria bacterium]|nr:hypothetical protein [Deltaproteobacteria bacterium]